MAVPGDVGLRPVRRRRPFRQARTVPPLTTKDAPIPSHWPTPPPGLDGAIALIVEGRPGCRALLVTDPMPGERLHASIPMTALATTNAIPAVVAAAPGHLSATDLPYYVSRRTP